MKETENKNMKEIQLRQQLASITVMDHGTEYRLTPEYVHQHMYAAVINTEKNAEMLERCPHEAISNLSVIAKCELGEGRTILVTDEFVQLLHMSGEEIMEQAQALVEGNFPYTGIHAAEASGQVSSHAGEEGAGLLDAALGHGHSDVLLLHQIVAAAGVIQQNTVILAAHIVAAILPVSHQ